MCDTFHTWFQYIVSVLNTSLENLFAYHYMSFSFLFNFLSVKISQIKKKSKNRIKKKRGQIYPYVWQWSNLYWSIVEKVKNIHMCNFILLKNQQINSVPISFPEEFQGWSFYSRRNLHITAIQISPESTRRSFWDFWFNIFWKLSYFWWLHILASWNEEDFSRTTTLIPKAGLKFPL